MQSFFNYLNKFRGGKHAPPRAPWHEVLWSAVGGFVGIYLVHLVGAINPLPLRDSLFLIGSFGASAVLIYGVPKSPYAQPRNLVGGHVVSAIVGVSCALALQNHPALAASLAVALALALMHLTNTIHPPGGATALIAVIGSERVHELGYWYVLLPVLIGAMIMLLVAVLINNLSPYRRYPEYWW